MLPVAWLVLGWTIWKLGFWGWMNKRWMMVVVLGKADCRFFFFLGRGSGSTDPGLVGVPKRRCRSTCSTGPGRCRCRWSDRFLFGDFVYSLQ
ncbi:hypothetical protein QBC41DRAFT_11140 [Cercophora samala]|uniref:Uncharacterized protein n=1 Tax=Cercophora samala TaxID=330535 RepID=A0AA39Z7U8_9PEZI|nr:hypothetical protein QBC41DRAFT_11140 [Cercophora samala]